jgi:enterochelin esterase family protein
VPVFLSAGGAAARHEDFVCRPDYARFVARDLVDSVRDEHPGVTEIVIAGLSLSGLAAAYAATRHPAVFRAAVCQSPSFWWERGRFADELPPATPAGPEFWISVGSRETEAGLSHPPSGLRQELTQVAGCVSAAAALRAKGYGVSYREYDGGHDPGCWRDDLSLALPRALRRGSPPSAGGHVVRFDPLMARRATSHPPNGRRSRCRDRPGRGRGRCSKPRRRYRRGGGSPQALRRCSF